MLFALGKTLLTEQVGPTPFGETVRLIDAPRPWSASSLSSGEVEASCSWFSPPVTASNRSRAAQESKTRGNAVLKNNKWRTRKVESDKLAAKLVKRSSRIRGKRQREKKWFDFFHPIFRFLEDELAWIGQSSNFSLRLLLKLGRKVRRNELNFWLRRDFSRRNYSRQPNWLDLNFRFRCSRHIAGATNYRRTFSRRIGRGKETSNFRTFSPTLDRNY